MSNKEITISIIIPVKNGIATLKSCLEAIFKQTLVAQIEVIIIDSGSTDGTLNLLKNYPVKLYSISPNEFNHGATRNYGVSLAKGEFVVMTVQDAVPADDCWLEKMFRHFEDPLVAGVCGQQIVPHHADKNPHQWFRPQSEGNFKKVHYPQVADFAKLSPEKQRQECGWDDVTAMYRKRKLVEIPFQPVMFGEDMIWAKEAIGKGYALIYDSTARVEHYHHHNPEYTYRRTLIVWLFTYYTFDFVREGSIKKTDYLKVVYRNFRWRLPLKWIWFNWSLYHSYEKGITHFKNSLHFNRLAELENYLSINIPQGKI